MREARTLSRDIEVAAIPYGDRIPLPAGSTVFVTQALGGSYTVMTERGYMVRVEGKDSDAIGEQPPPSATDPAASGKPVQEMAWDMLRTCYDPEIPVNIVDLGLVYQCEVAPLPEGGTKVSVRFTLTAPGCGMGDYLREDVRGKLLGLPGVTEADVQVVLEPPWNQGMMSDAARLQLGLM
jgi:probable FeS assembly SUF system protein SufT